MKKIIMMIVILTAVNAQANDMYTLEFDNGFKTTTECSDTVGGMFGYLTSEGIVLNIDTANVKVEKHIYSNACTKLITQSIQTLFNSNVEFDTTLFLIDNNTVTPLEK